MGSPLSEMLEKAGGMWKGRKIKGVTPGGSSVPILPVKDLDTPMDFESFRKAGVSLGSGALLICDQQTCIVDLVKVLLQFFRFESCGKCTPCRVGTQRAYEINSKVIQASDSMMGTVTSIR